MTANTEHSTDNEHPDIVVIGAGLGGLYSIYESRLRGFTVQAFEAAPDVGGVWYWNGYPGARCDVESLDYCYSFSEELVDEWVWSERFATQPEILRYVEHVADKFDLRRSIHFNERVTQVHFNERIRRWEIATDTGLRRTCKAVIAATGSLSAPNPPPVEGLASYEGRWYQTARWPREGVDLKDRRVAVIGTGSSGIQCIPLIAAEALHLTVFQRTPNYTMPAGNGPIDPAYEATVRADFAAHKRKALQTFFATPNQRIGDSVLAVSPEERTRAFEERWRTGGAGGIIVLYADIGARLEANEIAQEFVREKIRSIVKDPATAERLCPYDHPIGTKRPCLDTNYYQTFNRPNVSLVSLREEPIEKLTRTGVKTSKAEYEFDVIIFATGFDALTGALLAMDVRGSDGRSLKDAWAQGPETNLGLMVAGFPNFFTLTGPGSPSVLANMIAAIEQHVRWILDCLEFMRARGLDLIETTVEAQAAWSEEVQAAASRTLMPLAKSWYLGYNVPGKPHRFLPYVGGYPVYVGKCDDVAASGYGGFILSRESV